MDQTKVDVYPVADLKQQIWGMSTSIDGTISSSVTQEVHLLDKQMVDQIYVQEGQEVVEGTPLLSYDMTLVNIDLEMEKINKEQLLVKKKGLEKELEKLKNANIIPDSQKSENDEDEGGSDGNIVGAGSKSGILPLGQKEINDGPDGRWAEAFSRMAAAQNARASADSGNSDRTDPNSRNPDNTDQNNSNPDNSDQGNPDNSGQGNPDQGNPDQGNTDQGNPDQGNPDQGNPDQGNPDSGNPDQGNPDQGNSDQENPDPDPDKPDPDNPDPDNPNPDDPDKPQKPSPTMVYDKLYGDITLETLPGQKIENAVPYKGTGTKEDPYYYLCKKMSKSRALFST